VEFEISDSPLDATTHVVELGGEVDLYTAPRFEARVAEIIDAGKTHLVVDLRQTTFFDSTALSALIGGLRRVQAAGGSMAVACPAGHVLQVLDITGLKRLIPIYATRDEALAAASDGR
jgi:anti-sigma B factor antagonist